MASDRAADAGRESEAIVVWRGLAQILADHGVALDGPLSIKIEAALLRDAASAEREAGLMAELAAARARVSDLKFALGDGAGWFDRFNAARAESARATAERDEWKERASRWKALAKVLYADEIHLRVDEHGQRKRVVVSRSARSARILDGVVRALYAVTGDAETRDEETLPRRILDLLAPASDALDCFIAKAREEGRAEERASAEREIDAQCRVFADAQDASVADARAEGHAAGAAEEREANATLAHTWAADARECGFTEQALAAESVERNIRARGAGR